MPAADWIASRKERLPGRVFQTKDVGQKGSLHWRSEAVTLRQQSDNPFKIAFIELIRIEEIRGERLWQGGAKIENVEYRIGYYTVLWKRSLVVRSAGPHLHDLVTADQMIIGEPYPRGLKWPLAVRQLVHGFFESAALGNGHSLSTVAKQSHEELHSPDDSPRTPETPETQP